jgi:hypothetical protein
MAVRGDSGLRVACATACASLRQRAPSQREFARVHPVAYAQDATRPAEWRFCWSSIARTPWARPLVPARAGEAGAARPVCVQTREGLSGVGTCSPPTRSLWRDSTSRLGAPVGVNSPTL